MTLGWCKIYNQMAEERKNFAFTNILFTKVAHPATKSNNFGLIQNSKYFQIFELFFFLFFYSEEEPENSYHEEMEKIAQIFWIMRILRILACHIIGLQKLALTLKNRGNKIFTLLTNQNESCLTGFFIKINWMPKTSISWISVWIHLKSQIQF